MSSNNTDYSPKYEVSNQGNGETMGVRLFVGNLSFSLGTNDSYLNDPPTSLPPTKRNSFQFTMGLTYAIKPKN